MASCSADTQRRVAIDPSVASMTGGSSGCRGTSSKAAGFAAIAS